MYEDAQIESGSEFGADLGCQAPVSLAKGIKVKRLGETIVQASGEESSPGASESRRAVANR
jgi:hypothetical protein